MIIFVTCLLFHRCSLHLVALLAARGWLSAATRMCVVNDAHERISVRTVSAYWLASLFSRNKRQMPARNAICVLCSEPMSSRASMCAFHAAQRTTNNTRRSIEIHRYHIWTANKPEIIAVKIYLPIYLIFIAHRLCSHWYSSSLPTVLCVLLWQ